jgi:PTS system nitrogen regulatory IIA component
LKLPAWNRATAPVNLVANLLVGGRIALELDVRHRHALLGAAAGILSAACGLPRAEVQEALAARERLGSTALGLGVALPHGRVPGLKEPLAAYLRPEEPLLFDAPDDRPVTDFLVLLVPDRADERHLRILAEAAEMFSDPGFRGRLRAAASVAQVQAVFEQWKPWRA